MPHPVFLRQKQSSSLRLDAQRGKELGGHPHPGKALRLACAGNVPAPRESSAEALKKWRFAADFIDIAGVKSAQPRSGLRRNIPDPYQTLRVRVRQRRQQQAYNQSENRGGRAQAERQNQGSGKAERGSSE